MYTDEVNQKALHLFKVGDKIRILKKPANYSSQYGKSPMELKYPAEFTISELNEKTRMDEYVAMGTEEGFGFSMSCLIRDNIVELVNENNPKYVEIEDFTDRNGKIVKRTINGREVVVKDVEFDKKYVKPISLGHCLICNRNFREGEKKYQGYCGTCYSILQGQIGGLTAGINASGGPQTIPAPQIFPSDIPF